MAVDSRSLAWAELAHKRVSQRALVALLRAFGDPRAVLEASAAELARVVPAATAAAASTAVPAATLDATRRWLDEPSHHLIAWDDADYPRALLEIGHAPPALFYIGARELLNRPALAIVGSRHATPQGKTNARSCRDWRLVWTLPHTKAHSKTRHRRSPSSDPAPTASIPHAIAISRGALRPAVGFSRSSFPERHRDRSTFRVAID